MITKEAIQEIYKRYPKRAKSVDDLNFGLLFDSVGAMHDINVDFETNRLVIGSLDNRSIFRSIPLHHIHAFVPFEEWTAIVLNASILFLNKKAPDVSIHLKPQEQSVADRLKSLFGR